MPEFKTIDPKNRTMPELNTTGGFGYIPNSTMPAGSSYDYSHTGGNRFSDAGSNVHTLPPLDKPEFEGDLEGSFKSGMDKMMKESRAELEAMEERRRQSADPRETMMLIRMMIAQLMKERMGILLDTMEGMQQRQRDLSQEDLKKAHEIEDEQKNIENAAFYSRALSWITTGTLSFAAIGTFLAGGAGVPALLAAPFVKTMLLGLTTKVLMDAEVIDSATQFAAENIAEPLGFDEEESKSWIGRSLQYGLMGLNVYQLWSGWNAISQLGAVGGGPLGNLVQTASEVTTVGSSIAQVVGAHYGWRQAVAEIERSDLEAQMEHLDYFMDLYTEYVKELSEKMAAIVQGASSDLRNEFSSLSGIIRHVV